MLNNAESRCPLAQLALFNLFSNYNYLMRTVTEVNQQQFQQKLQFQSMVNPLSQSQPLPLYKLTIRPFDYYIQFSFQADLARLHFYQELQTASTLIVAPQHITVAQIEKSYFDRWFGMAEKSRFSITCYLKYYNYTIRSWIDHQKQCNSVISEQEILMVLRQLLTFHKFYQQFYRQSCGIFKAELIFITPEKSLRVYPQSIQYNGQISIKKEQQTYLNLSAAKLDKLGSFETTLSNSQVNTAETNGTEYYDSSLNPDLRDIFILALQLISFKKYEHFYSHKHSMIIWDAVSSLLNSISVSHLSNEFIHLLKQCGTIKNFDSQWLLTEVEKLICTKERMCKTVHIEKNQQLAELVMKKVQSERSKKLDELKYLNQREIRRSLTQSFHSY